MRPDPRRLGWEQGPGAGRPERELATFILAGILQVPSPRHGFDSATQEECVFPGDTETCFHKPGRPLGAPWDGKMVVIWLWFRMPEPA